MNKRLARIGRDADGSDVDYVRVASVDSPFREMVAWAYMQVAARPGLPERNWDAWADEVFQAVSALRQGESA